MEFPRSVTEKLRYYVYLYLDPRDKTIFYVGKGKGNRCFSHLTDKSDCQKFRRIQEIRADGLEPVIELLVHGVTEEVASKVEACVIDLVDLNKLTNLQKGHSSSKYGRMSVDKVISIYCPVKADILEPSLLLKINKTFRYSMSKVELYDATRQFWRIGDDRNKVEFAFAVFDGVIQEVYKVISWHKAGSTFSTRSTDQEDRWEFIGQVAPDRVRDKYIYKDVSDITRGQSPFYYLNIGDSAN